MVLRILFALLVGFLVGFGAAFYLVNSGAGDFVIRRTEAVQDLERRLREVEQQRDQLGRALEDVNARAARMEGAFGDLERRFRGLQNEVERGRPTPEEPRPPT